jgi:DNA repair ATPase RecN
MQTLGREHQLICITYLRKWRRRFYTLRCDQGCRTRPTFSNLREVTGNRAGEIAQMLGGKSESALKLAASLLKECLTPRNKRNIRKFY